MVMDLSSGEQVLEKRDCYVSRQPVGERSSERDNQVRQKEHDVYVSNQQQPSQRLTESCERDNQVRQKKEHDVYVASKREKPEVPVHYEHTRQNEHKSQTPEAMSSELNKVSQKPNDYVGRQHSTETRDRDGDKGHYKPDKDLPNKQHSPQRTLTAMSTECDKNSQKQQRDVDVLDTHSHVDGLQHGMTTKCVTEKGGALSKYYAEVYTSDGGSSDTPDDDNETNLVDQPTPPPFTHSDITPGAVPLSRDLKISPENKGNNKNGKGDLDLPPNNQPQRAVTSHDVSEPPSRDQVSSLKEEVAKDKNPKGDTPTVAVKKGRKRKKANSDALKPVKKSKNVEETKEGSPPMQSESTEQSSTATFLCPFCNLACPSAELLREHLKEMHMCKSNIEAPSFACHMCGFSCSNPEEYTDHFTSTHQHQQVLKKGETIPSHPLCDAFSNNSTTTPTRFKQLLKLHKLSEVEVPSNGFCFISSLLVAMAEKGIFKEYPNLSIEVMNEINLYQSINPQLVPPHRKDDFLRTCAEFFEKGAYTHEHADVCIGCAANALGINLKIFHRQRGKVNLLSFDCTRFASKLNVLMVFNTKKNSKDNAESHYSPLVDTTYFKNEFASIQSRMIRTDPNSEGTDQVQQDFLLAQQLSGEDHSKSFVDTSSKKGDYSAECGHDQR